LTVPERAQMSTKDKPSRLQARLPRGFADRGPAEIAATRRLIETIRAVYELYGFEPLETPAIEYSDTLGKFLPDQDRPNEGVFSFKDDDDQWLSLRYDLTAPLARFVAENFDRLPKPYRSYRFGWVFRNEKPGPGRFRQFMQFDADTVGAPSAAADAEICMMAADTMEKLGIPRGSYVVKVNNRKVLEGLREALGGASPLGDAQWLAVLRSIDKLDRLGADEVALLLTRGRTDESGDVTKGAELSTEQADAILRFLGFAVRHDGSPRYRVDRPASSDTATSIARLSAGFELGPTGQQGIAELREIARLTQAAGYEADRIAVDPSVVRGLEYYTGPVYEADLTFDIKDESGRLVRFGSVGGGGRYDALVARFRGEAVPATGFSIGVSRLMAALSHLDQHAAAPQAGPVVVLAMDRERIPDYQRLASRLREAGIRAEIYLGAAGMKAQMRYADRRGAPCVIIQGSDERAKGEVQIKDLIQGAKEAAAIASNQEWRATRPAQFAVREHDLVEAVRRVLDGQDAARRSAAP
jgi:histidyl-tRNA synthetase